MPETPTRFKCRHIRTAGHRCGSPALRNESFCFYHHTTRGRAAERTALALYPATHQDQATFTLPALEDRPGIHLAIAETVLRLAANQVDVKRAGLILYGLQIALRALPPQPRALPAKDAFDAPEPIENPIFDPAEGPLAPIADFDEDDDDGTPNPPTQTFYQRFMEEFHRDNAAANAKALAELAKSEAATNAAATAADNTEPNTDAEPAILPTLQAAAEPTQHRSPKAGLLKARLLKPRLLESRLLKPSLLKVTSYPTPPHLGSQTSPLCTWILDSFTKSAEGATHISLGRSPRKSPMEKGLKARHIDGPRMRLCVACCFDTTPSN